MRSSVCYLLLLFWAQHSLWAQSCISQRYISTVFNQADVTSSILFGNADPYGLSPGQNLYLDVYAPAGDTLSKRPVIVYAYGGGFLIGTRNQPPIPYFGEQLARRGFVFVAIDYRLGFNTVTPGSPERAVYRAVQDLRAAVRHLAQRENTYRIDTNHIIYMGSSAGCFAGLHSAFMEESEAAAFDDPIPLLDPENLGPINVSGNNDYGNRHIDPFAIVNLWGAIADTNFIEATEQIPVISFHGDQDNAVPYQYGYPFSYPIFPSVYGSFPIHRRLNHVGIPNELHTLFGYGHEPELLAPELRDTILNNGSAFLYNLIRPVTAPINGDTSVCVGQQLTYNVPGPQPGSRFCWSVSGPAQLTAQANEQITLTVTGPGIITLQVRELNALQVNGDLRTLLITAAPQPTASASIVSADELQLILSLQQTNGTASVLLPGDGQSVTGSPTSYTYSQPGTYEIIWEVTNGNCVARDTQWAVVDTCPQAFFSYNNSGLWVQFTASSTNTGLYQWDWGNGVTFQSNSPNAIYTFPQPGVYPVTLTVLNALGCSQSFTDTLRLLPNPINELLAKQPQVFPNPASAQLTICWVATATQPIEAELTDLSGKIVQQFCLEEEKTIIDVAGIPAGSYFIRLRSGHSLRVEITH